MDSSRTGERSKTIHLLAVGLTCALCIVGCDGNDLTETPVDDSPPPRFDEVTDTLPLPPAEEQGDYGAFWSDFDADGRVDLMFMGHGSFPLLLRQRERGAFVDVSENYGLKSGDWEYPQQRDRHGGSCADFDKDGLVDLFISHGAFRGETLGIKYDELLKGNGDFTFTDVSRNAGATNPQGRGRLGTWADIDGDGLLDLYVANFDSPNVMYRNDGDGTFTDVTEAAGLAHAGFHAAWSDFDGDGHVDLLVAAPLRLLRNAGGGTFEDVTRQWTGEEDRFAYGIAWADIDADGDQDFLVSALDSGISTFVNLGGRFRQIGGAPLPGTRGMGVTGIAPVDIDNDGDFDIVASTSAGIRLHRNVGDWRHVVYALAPRSGDPVDTKQGDIAVADYDDDGLLDFATDDPAGYRLFRNATETAAHWLRFEFDGEANDTLGFGNKVWITVDDELVAYREYHGAMAGLRSFGCSPLQVGLGEHSIVDVRVRWPNGSESVFRGVDADRTLRVVQ